MVEGHNESAYFFIEEDNWLLLYPRIFGSTNTAFLVFYEYHLVGTIHGYLPRIKSNHPTSYFGNLLRGY